MSNFMDDVLGIDPPPEPPEAKDPVRPPPVRRVATSNVAVGVDRRRKLLGQNTGGSSKSSRSLVVDNDDALGLGVGLNV